MEVITVVALMVAMHMPPAFGCSTDMLKKISEDHLDRLPSGAQHDFIDPANSQQGGTWQMFVGENGLPHSLVVAWLGEIGQTRLRISFLSRRDFVIAETRINFTEPVSAQDHTGKFEVQPPRHYFFCNRKLQGVADTKTAESANRWKNWFFEEADMLKPELQRIPE